MAKVMTGDQYVIGNKLGIVTQEEVDRVCLEINNSHGKHVGQLWVEKKNLQHFVCLGKSEIVIKKRHLHLVRE